ncbi:MAG: tetraacyldisaccharide 4'-kinase [Gemmatimonadota bacterium]|nr:tetraacyldisaccharide 4'-kinase [Gemmatimonadota bacterium]
MSGPSGRGLFWNLKWWAVGFFGALLLRLIYLTVRIRVNGQERLAVGRRVGHGPVIYAIWHGRLLGQGYHSRNQGICVLVSRHRDGEIISRIAARLGFVSGRGSSTRGSTAGLKHMLRMIRSGRDIGFTVDGPRGPAGTVSPGVVYAASRSGCPIVPAAVGYSRCWKLGSWDSFRIPKPFCRMVAGYGEPIVVPKNLDEKGIEEYTRIVADSLGRLCRLADNLAPAVKVGKTGVARSLAEKFLNRRRNHWYLLPVLVPLLPLEWAWRLAWSIRDRLYSWEILRVTEPPVPTVCVGSLYVGGAGKTPLAIMLAGRLAARGIRTAILTRGYGGWQGKQGKTSGKPLIVPPMTRDQSPQPAHVARMAGDEAALAWWRLKECGIAVCARRTAGARAAVEELGAEVLVMDDGFGHRSLGRNLDLLVTNGRLMKITRHMLPAGALREPHRAARRAHAVVLSSIKSGQSIEPPAWAAGLQTIRVRRTVTGLVPLDHWLKGIFPQGGEPLPGDALRGEKVLGFCGIARPEGFRETLAKLDPESIEVVAFADHCPYSEKTQRSLADRAKKLDAVLVTTEKDAVKLDPEAVGAGCLVLTLELEPEDGEVLDRMLDKLMGTVLGLNT